MTFIDDESKDQIFDTFKYFHLKVKREIEKLLEYIPTDNGSECTSKMFDDYCVKHSIKHRKSVPHTP